MVKRGLRFDAMLCVWLAVLGCVAGGSVASAQQPPAAEPTAEAEEPAGPADQFDRGVPRSAMRASWLRAWTETTRGPPSSSI